eukprot:TRINITY_DN44905_c0_g1_i1.p1 TRINITY_DN44905_c0_g1~~TRINITY_DN44905_c0_g1_i1.p1  ORF type:complete len:264 (+),score=109.40 TRINITY_DN44905_c0_g1_i1:111-902(+)
MLRSLVGSEMCIRDREVSEAKQESLRADLSQAHRELEKLQSEYKAMQNEMETVVNDVAQMESALEAAKVQQAQQQVLWQNSPDKSPKANGPTQAEMDELELALDEAEDALEATGSKLTLAEAKISRLEAGVQKKEELHLKVDELETQLEIAKATSQQSQTQVIALMEQAQMAEVYQQRIVSLESDLAGTTTKLQAEKRKSVVFGETASTACDSLRTKLKHLSSELTQRADKSPLSADVADFCARLAGSVNSMAASLNPASVPS